MCFIMTHVTSLGAMPTIKTQSTVSTDCILLSRGHKVQKSKLKTGLDSSPWRLMQMTIFFVTVVLGQFFLSLLSY